MMRAAEEGTRRQGTRCDQTGRCREWEPGEQEEVGKDQPEVGAAERVGPGWLGLAGYDLTQCGFLCGVDHPIVHHPVAVQRVVHLAHA